MTDRIKYTACRNAVGFREAQLQEMTDTSSGIGRNVLFGLFTLAMFLWGSAYWAFASKLDGAVVVPAIFVVADGKFVEAGQPLVPLDSAEIDVDLSGRVVNLGASTAGGCACDQWPDIRYFGECA